MKLSPAALDILVSGLLTNRNSGPIVNVQIVKQVDRKVYAADVDSEIEREEEEIAAE